MDRENTYIISYFVGDNYNNIQYVRQWYENLRQYYLIDKNRKFVIITDNIFLKIFEELNDDVIFFYIDPQTTKDLNTNKRAKFIYILDWLNATNITDGYIAFIQSNARCNTNIKFEDMADLADDLTFNVSYWYLKNNNIAKNSKLIEYNKDFYIQAGHFIGKTYAVKKLAEWICKKMEEDANKQFFPKWHDEYYVNMYYHLYKIP